MNRLTPLAICLIVAFGVTACNKRNSTEVKTAIGAAAVAESAGDRAAMQKALESIPADVRTPEELQKLEQLKAAKVAMAHITAAEAIGDRAALQKALESIPANLRTRDEVQKIAQLGSVATAASEIIVTKKAGDRAALKKAVESVKRLRLPVSSDEESDLTLAAAGIAFESELELARQKSDIDGLFLALTKLERASFLAPSEAELLGKCRQTLQELQTMRGHQAKHDHESVVQSADVILSAFPDNVEARKAFSESGLIFAYLESATQALSGITGGAKSDAIVAAVKAEDDIGNKIAKLAEADKHLAEALKLDPQYAHSLAMQGAVQATQNVIAGLMAERVVKNAGKIMETSEEMAITVFNQVNDETRMSLQLASRYSPARGYWEIYNNRYREKLDEAAKVCRQALGNQAEQVALLKALKNQENADLVDQAVRIVENADVVMNGYIMPSGTWSEYSNTINRSQALMKDVTSKFLSAYTGYQPVATRGLETMTTIFTIQYFRDADRTKPILKKRQELLLRRV